MVLFSVLFCFIFLSDSCMSAMSRPNRTWRVWRRLSWVKHTPSPSTSVSSVTVFPTLSPWFLIPGSQLFSQYNLPLKLQCPVLSSSPLLHLSFYQARELQTLHNLRKLFVQDLTSRVKKVSSSKMIRFFVFFNPAKEVLRNVAWIPSD